ncbi:MAG: hypothetical protein ACOH1T_08870 [Microbacteriaceae bacterium]
MNEPSPDGLSDAELVNHLLAWLEQHYDSFRRTTEPNTFAVRRDRFLSMEVTVQVDAQILRSMMGWLLEGGRNLEPEMARSGQKLSAAWSSFAVGLQEAIDTSPGHEFTLSSKTRQMLEPGPVDFEFP